MSADPHHPQRKLALLLAGMALLLLAVIAAGWWLQHLADHAADSRQASSQRLLILEKTLGSLQAAETAQRGYLITANPRYLEPFAAARTQAHDYQQQLLRLYADDPVATRLLDRLRRWQRLKIEELEDTLEAQRISRDFAEVLASADYGRRYTAQIDKVIRELQAIEATGNASLRELVSRRRAATFAAALALTLLALAACVVVYRLLRREAALRQGLHEQMAHDAFHDALTALPNRRYLIQELERALTRSRRKDGVTALLFIDLDGFKRVNDALGHEVGDEVLRRAGAQFVCTARQSDFVARLGGDEFAVVMEGEGRDSAAALAERLIAALRAPLLARHPEYPVSASIGVAVFPHDGTDTSVLLARADQAMYLAKRGGKARAVSLAA
jgi:diguanylate cyclase (GGDEF)-like protein